MTNQVDLVKSAQQAFAAGDYAHAQELALTHLRSVPTSLPAQSVLANASNALQDFAQAMAALDALHTALPNDPAIRKALAMACNNRGSQFFQAGDIDAAAPLYERATQLDDGLTLAWTNLTACAIQRRRHDVAAHCYQHQLTLDPLDADAAINLANSLRALGQEHQADALLDGIAIANLSNELRVALAMAFERSGRPEHAATIVACDDPHLDSAAHERMAKIQAACGNIVEARRNLAWMAQHAGSETRERFRAERDAALLVPAVFSNRAEIDAWRAEYAARLQRFFEDWPPARLARNRVELGDLSHSRLRVAYQGENDLPVARNYGDWLAASAAQLLPDVAAAATARPIRRVGFVSARWTRSTIASYFGAWPEALQTAGFQVHLYNISDHEDAMSRSITAQVDHASRLPDDLAAAARQLRAAELDLLIYPEIGLDGAPEVLASLRLAAHQWAAWGHPVTTGLPTIDRYVSVATMEPAYAQDDYRESLLLLPGVGTRLQRAARAAPYSRGRFGLPDSGALYLLPHHPLKLHPDTDDLVAAVLQRDATARVVFFADELPALTLLHRHRLEAWLAREAIDTTDRLFWLPRQPKPDFHALLAGADVVLDTPHFSGGATSLETFAQNTPIVTVESRHMRGRQTAAMLRMLDLPDLICIDVQAAATRAVEIARNKEEQARLRALLVERTPVLFDQTEPLHSLCAQVHEASASN